MYVFDYVALAGPGRSRCSAPRQRFLPTRRKHQQGRAQGKLHASTPVARRNLLKRPCRVARPQCERVEWSDHGGGVADSCLLPTVLSCGQALRAGGLALGCVAKCGVHVDALEMRGLLIVQPLAWLGVCHGNGGCLDEGDAVFVCMAAWLHGCMAACK